jgi:SAM-dependent methyltransferase
MEPLDYRERRYLSAVEAAKFLGVSVRFVHQMVSEGLLPVQIAASGQQRFALRDLERVRREYAQRNGAASPPSRQDDQSWELTRLETMNNLNNFEEILQRYLEKLTELRQRSASEASIREEFLRFLRTAFPHLGLSESIELEKFVPGLRVQGGFVDALYGDLIFEFKRKLDDHSRKDGEDKLQRYLINQENPDRFFGILTDGETLEVYALREEKLTKVDGLRLSVETAEKCRLWLDCYLFHEKLRVPTADDITLRFGQHSPTFWHSFRLLRSAWQRARDDLSVRTKFAEWQSLLAIVYGSTVGDENLFLRHTYLALFARVLAFVSLQRKSPDDDELVGLVSGETFEKMGLENFIADDFFAWCRDCDETKDLLRSLATRLTTTYDLNAINEDLLKGLYQGLVDPETRHDLGEFYTPDWLAELTLRKAGYPDACSPPSLLDPACGSGTFLFIAIHLLREAGYANAELVQLCASNLAGIDVHPLAVTIARTNFILALGRDLRGFEGRLSVPIYLADSLNLPENLAQQEVLSVPVDTENLSTMANKEIPKNLPQAFHIPAEVAAHPNRLSGVINALLEFADHAIGEKDANRGLSARLAELGIPSNQQWWWQSNLRLMRWLLQPPATDTVWRFILQNAYRPALLAHRKFAFVVGNPPWLAYRYIQRRDYQERVRRLALNRYKLLSSEEAQLFTQMELATLFFAFCAEHYLADDGTLAFIMPRSVLTGAKQHAEFRQRYVATARLIIDCERVSPLFNVPTCAVLWGKQPQAAPMLQLEGNLPTHNASWQEAQGVLRQTEATFIPPTALGESPYLERVTQGATIVPRCLWFVRPYAQAVVVNRARPQLETDSQIESRAKKPWQNIRLDGSVEADFLFATLLSDDLLPFGWRRLRLVVLPLAKRSRGRKLLSDIDAVRLGKIGLANWLRNANELWVSHRKSQVSLSKYLDWKSKLTSQSPTGVYKLLYNTSGTHLCACVVDAREVSEWRVHNLPVQGFVADTTTYWLETKSKNEAHYLCAILNAPCVDAFIKPFQAKGAFGSHRGKGERHIHRRPFEVLPIPNFDTKDPQHRRLAQLSMACHAIAQQFVADADTKTLTQSIGRLRQKLREKLTDDITQINQIVTELLELSP